MPWYVNQAIIKAYADGFVKRFDTIIAGMRALTSLSKPKAEEYLRNTKPIVCLEDAISAALVLGDAMGFQHSSMLGQLSKATLLTLIDYNIQNSTLSSPTTRRGAVLIDL